MEDEELDKKIRPPFCRVGSKFSIVDKLIPLIPPHKTYVELFLGSGAVFFNKPKAFRSILNDLDESIVKQMHVIKKAPLKEELYKQDLNTLPKLNEFYMNHSNSNADLLLVEKIRACNGFGGIPVRKTNKIYQPSNPFSIFKNLAHYKDKLKGAIITNDDYETIVKKYDSIYTFFFIDPPYENTSNTFGYAESEDFSFDRLLTVLKSIKGKFLMTINNSARIKKLFKDFYIKTLSVPSTQVFNAAKNEIRKELLITNYII